MISHFNAGLFYAVLFHFQIITNEDSKYLLSGGEERKKG
jgi:hypothetical protein